jgi:hypothetical protein
LYSPVDPYYGRFINKYLDITPDQHQRNHDSVYDREYHFYDIYSMESPSNGNGTSNGNEWSSLFRPHSLFLQPVLVSAPREGDNSTDLHQNNHDDSEQQILVGFLASIVAWDSFLGTFNR